ncbi:hypothetical protein N7541_009475 [Penicillium brevicompactum]|uniref:Uncharacterized protein n=1 Tax=Penicillium brevicompactum TaxID=5074 RepID=A0A9W9QLN3_PENBR|nr:hypothetical protein N7541_009475 [Penicillium brevicompactum]
MAKLPAFRTLRKDDGENDGEIAPRTDSTVLYHQETELYRLATLALIEKIRRSNDEEIQELGRSIQESNSLSEAVQKALELK